MEIPEHLRLSRVQAFLQFQKPMMESRRVRTVLEHGEPAARMLYEHDKAAWLHRAAAYERQLEEISTAHAATEREMRATIDDRHHEVSSLRKDLMERDSVIKGLGLRCDELNAALTVVQNELKRDREQSRTQREQEMRDFEARLMGSTQVGY